MSVFVLAGNRLWFYILLMYLGVQESCGVVFSFFGSGGKQFLVFHTYGTYCTIQLCGCVSFGSGGKLVLVLHIYVFRVQHNCGVVLVFWSWREIVIDFTYVLSEQYSCGVVSVFWCWQEIVLKMRTRFYKKILLGYFIMIR